MYKTEQSHKKNTKGLDKYTFIMLIVLFLISGTITGFIIFKVLKTNKTIGTVYGENHEYIKIENTIYQADPDCELPSEDRNKLLGKVVFEEGNYDPMYVWEMKGTSQEKYLYVLWGSEVTYYKKTE